MCVCVCVCVGGGGEQLQKIPGSSFRKYPRHSESKKDVSDIKVTVRLGRGRGNPGRRHLLALVFNEGLGTCDWRPSESLYDALYRPRRL